MNLMTTSPASRPYRKIERARQEEETRRRITEAAVELHRTVGPANTTVTEVAKRAGVSRMTVYNHFPSDADLFRACSSHWASCNPFPDPSRWAAIEDPSERLLSALNEFYEWYALKEDMLGKIFRDVPLVPSLETTMDDLWSPYADELVRTLASGWSVSTDDRTALEAALRLALDFNTWRVLEASGLDSDRAAELTARMVSRALEPQGGAAFGQPRGSDLSVDLEERLRGFFARGVSGIVSAYLFGSHAEGRTHRESDVDVGVLLDLAIYPTKDARSELRITLASDVSATAGTNAVDLVVLNDAPPELGRRIVLDGHRVFCSDPEADHTYRRDVQLRAADLAPFLRRTRRTKLDRLAR
ncbi:MAG: TetR family transcriptional regulator [Gemmatimonadota bacterium]